MPYIKGSKPCARTGCFSRRINPDAQSIKEALRAGWFFQRNGVAWCPQHNPDWVAEWRKKQFEKREARRDARGNQS